MCLLWHEILNLDISAFVLQLFDFIFGFLLVGPVLCCVTIIFLFRAVFSMSVSLSCPTVCIVLLQIACLLLDE